MGLVPLNDFMAHSPPAGDIALVYNLAAQSIRSISISDNYECHDGQYVWKYLLYHV